MTLFDARGTALSTTRQASVDAYDEALDLFNSFRADALAVLDAALAAEPGFVSGRLMQAGLILGSFDGALLGMARESFAAAEACAATANERERSLLAALRPWTLGDLQGSSRLLGRHVIDHPRDLFALQLAHLVDLVLGQSEMLRDRIGRAIGHWSSDDEGYGYVLGMHAFGLEECNEYARAEAAGRRAVELQPHDAWAVHAVAHVCEMQGRADEGLAWLTETRRHWSEQNSLAVHNHWHMALMHLSRGDEASALALYDGAVTPGPQALAMDLDDASALLWRLTLAGVPVQGRWASLAARWRAQAAWGHMGFNDVHAMMAMVGADDMDGAAECADAIAAAAARSSAPGWRSVALPFSQALQAFAAGRHATCAELLLPVLAASHSLGGSHAQRDILRLTCAEAARRGGDDALVQALATQRRSQKQRSATATTRSDEHAHA
jgi:tetratricopeptide (TPR) repeat protein